MPVTALEWVGGHIRLLDQTRLPGEVAFLELQSYREVIEAIRQMRVRGAPAIGIAGAYATVLAAWELPSEEPSAGWTGLRQRAQEIASARPTAVNLPWAVARVLKAAQDARAVSEARERLLIEALRIQEEEEAADRQIACHGAALIPQGATVLTHCNTGALATGGYGTALGIIRRAWKQGRLRRVIATETRPQLQGARLTAWELGQEGIPVSLIVDSAAGSVLQRGLVSCVVVGADRIVANGDVANKIGTYPLAVLASEHRVPFYVAAPSSTIDLNTPTGGQIVIEERRPEEVTAVRWAESGAVVVPEGVDVLNPAFDVTPARYVSAIITEVGVMSPPYEQKLEGLKKSSA